MSSAGNRPLRDPRAEGVTAVETPERTPALEALLHALRRSLLCQVVLYGIGTILGASVLWLAFAFLADWGLRVPTAIRVFHGAVLLGVIGLFAWRDLVRPLFRLPDRAGLAILLERANPELRQLLISAVQFQDVGAGPDADPALVALVVDQAENRARTLSPRGVLDPEAPRARFLLGLGGVLFLGLLAFFHPLHARIFAQRLFGGGAPWPQRTELLVEIPGLDPSTIVEHTGERWRLRLARGTDVALLITARGVVPEELTLHFDDGRDLVLNPSGGNLFRTLLRSCQEDLAFHVTGGDDEDGLPRIEIEVLQPPDVEGIAVVVRPPAYSALPESTLFDQDVEVLKGSALRVHVLPQPADARGLARLLPEDVTLPLVPLPFPRRPDSAPDEPERPGLSFELAAERTVGFRAELTDRNGLTNPDPGLFRIRVIEDRPPEVQALAPSRSEFETVRGGAIPLRARAEDDFGLTAMGWRLANQGAGPEEPPLRSGSFELERRPDPAPRPRGSAPARDSALGSARLEVDSLGTPEAPVPVDSRFALVFHAQDNRVPEPAEGHSLEVRVRVVTPEELLRRMQDRLAQARMAALRLSELQREKRARVEELLDSLEGDEPLETGESLALSAALAGQRRVLSDSQALARDLAAAAEDVLYARLDDKAANLLEFLDARLAVAGDLRFQALAWRELARESAAGRLASEGFAANLVRLVELALEISEDHATAAVESLDSAEKALAALDVATALVQAQELQTRVFERTEALLQELAAWDNFQNVLTLARDILNRQKNLRDLTQQFASEK